MPDRGSIVASIEEYCRAQTAKDKSGWLALFADNIRHEDPVGAQANEGRERVAAFWDAIQAYDLELWLDGSVIVCGNEAIAPMRARLGPANDRKEAGPIYDHLIFDESGKIQSLRAFYEPF